MAEVECSKLPNMKNSTHKITQITFGKFNLVAYSKPTNVLAIWHCNLSYKNAMWVAVSINSDAEERTE